MYRKHDLRPKNVYKWKKGAGFLNLRFEKFLKYF